MKYSQVKAMFAITRASLRSILSTPSALIFSIIFPFIFIVVFGFIGNGNGMQNLNIVIANNADTTNEFYYALKNTDGVKIIKFKSVIDLTESQKKGNIAGIINIRKNQGGVIPYNIELKSTNSSDDKWPLLKSLIENKINEVSDGLYKQRPVIAKFDFDYKKDITEIRQYKRIDFILPGQIGFSLLGSGVFGMAFTFFNLRNLMVLKRFFATPISRTYIILGEALSRIIFQMLTAIIIISVGHFLFDFTLINGFVTFLEMLFISFFGLVIFMGFGFIISGIAKNDSTIPAFANLVIMPQFILAGTFFPVEVFPKWLQHISNILPLTHFNTLMRSIAFEGKHFWEVSKAMKLFSFEIHLPLILILLLWAIIVYVIAIKVFKWE